MPLEVRVRAPPPGVRVPFRGGEKDGTRGVPVVEAVKSLGVVD